VPELGTLGSVRGARRNPRPYRDSNVFEEVDREFLELSRVFLLRNLEHCQPPFRLSYPKTLGRRNSRGSSVRFRDSTRFSGESGAIGNATPQHSVACRRFTRKNFIAIITSVQSADNFNELLVII
jgi:hypothetical protein